MTSNISFTSSQIVFLALLFCATYAYCRTTSLDESDVHGYHFHVYFYPGAPRSSQDAIGFRDAIQNQISSGHLADCIVKPVNMGPYGPHMVGNYETCCNKTSIPQALSFFMLNHGNLSVLVHPLT
ncbi:DOPA 4,5-dioxygenase [Orchesella cincta]|uniref:DOPA 4,5-dioxygenase n=1 Tax=Orchesella cincta TaxID=48709 RepID=A0A1D2NAJ9_ORCCI|nr:DOPA 4,5-dioxygenase [Orchesella cincta]